MNPARWLRYGLSLFGALWLQFVWLPPAVAPWRPIWPALIIATWTLNAPRMPNLLAAALLGLACDLLANTPPGEHALALLGVAFVLTSLRPRVRDLPLWRAALLLMPLWALYSFALFWIDGLSNHPADPWLRWMPVLATTLAWPAVVMIQDALRARPRQPQRL